MLDAGRDQAAGLRRLMARPPLRVLAFPVRPNAYEPAVASLSRVLRDAGRKPVVVDAAGGAASGAFGLRPRLDLLELLEGRREFDDVVEVSTDGVHVVRADAGVEAFVASGAPARTLLGAFARLSHGFDHLLLVMRSAELASLAPPPATVPVISLVSGPVAAYELMKELSQGFGYRRFACVGAPRQADAGPRDHERVAAAAAKFLAARVEYAGSEPDRLDACATALD